MTKRSVIHDTFVIERPYAASAARVFAAFASEEAKSAWGDTGELAKAEPATGRPNSTFGRADANGLGTGIKASATPTMLSITTSCPASESSTATRCMQMVCASRYLSPRLNRRGRPRHDADLDRAGCLPRRLRRGGGTPAPTRRH